MGSAPSSPDDFRSLTNKSAETIYLRRDLLVPDDRSIIATSKQQNGSTFQIRDRYFYSIKSTKILQKDEMICNVTGITQLPNDSIVLIDSKNCKVKLLDSAFNFVSQLTVPDWPLDACMVTGDTIAVTVCDTRDRHEVHFISVQNNTLKADRLFKLNHKCSAIESHDDFLYIGSFDTVFKYKLSGQLAAIVYQNRVENNYYPTVQRFTISKETNQMYITDYRNNAICIIDLNEAKPVHKICHSGLEFPTGISLANSGHIFVSCCKSSEIILVDGNNEDVNIIATQTNGVYRPEAIHFNEKTHSLIVGQHGDNVIVFFLEYFAKGAIV